MQRISLLTLGGKVLDLARRGAARKLEVTPAADQVRRGESLSVSAGSESGEAGLQLEVGLVCTETYATFLPSEKLTVSDRAMVDAVAYEAWLPARPGESVSLGVPADGPYSYDGKHLKFAWRVGVRAPRRGLDAVKTSEIRVLP